MQPNDISADDPELIEILGTIRKQTLSMSEIIDGGPHKRTKVYEDVNTGRLATFISSGRRFALAIDYGRYLLFLKRQGAGAAPDKSKSARDRRLMALQNVAPEQDAAA
jgi:hypothetical protein